MILSMTGLGTATADRGAFRGAVTLRSVNHRFLELSLRLPPSLTPLEPELKELVGARVRRGRVEVNVRGVVTDAPVRVTCSKALAGSLVQALRELATEHGLDARLSAGELARFPGLFEVVDDPERESEAARGSVVALVSEALARLDAMRAAEGTRLGLVIRRHTDEIAAAVERLVALEQEFQGARRTQIAARARELVSELGLDEGRLLQEIARLVDRSDVCEELERLRSHVAQAREVLQGSQPCGKTLDFLAQEMTREANTIGSKMAGGAVGRAVIGLKSEIERLREQVQNVE
jgi:uncharacterized protein (TIGR00255 family)